MGQTTSANPADGIYITGLKLHNGYWDSKRCSARPLDMNSSPTSAVLPTLQIVPKVKQVRVDDSKPEPYTIQCPVVYSSVVYSSGASEISVDIPVLSVADGNDLMERRVYISSSFS